VGKLTPVKVVERMIFTFPFEIYLYKQNMQILKIIRSSDWWSYKVAPLVSISYITLSHYHIAILPNILRLVSLVCYIASAATYVSIINDFCDKEEDLIAGKRNNFSNGSRAKTFLLLTVALGLVVACILRLKDKPYSALFFFLTLLTYSLYSFPPVRLKSRGWAGALADASGAHLFITLFVVSYLNETLVHKVSIGWYFSWASLMFLYGVRGILWHQNFDKKNDAISNIKTVAAFTSQATLERLGRIIFGCELFALCLIFLNLLKPTIMISMLVYVLILLYRVKVLEQQAVIVTARKTSYHFLMSDYYEVILPVFILIIYQSPNTAAILAGCHLVMFPSKFLQLFGDIADILRRTYYKLNFYR
jgi:hypothetical protein